MGKIVIIGVGNAGRSVLKKLKDDGLDDVEMMSFGYFLDPDDKHDDIPHHNLITMNGDLGVSSGCDHVFWRGYAENASEQIIDKAFVK